MDNNAYALQKKGIAEVQKVCIRSDSLICLNHFIKIVIHQ